MEKHLEQIEKEISEFRQNFSRLRTQLLEQEEQLKNSQENLRVANLEGGDTENYVTEISMLQIKIQGTRSALETLKTNITALEEKKDQENNRIRLINAEKTKIESRLLFRELYLLIIQLVEKLCELSDKSAEYRSFLKKTDPHDLQGQLNRNISAREILANETHKVLDLFAVDVFDRDGLPTVDSLRAKIKPWVSSRR